MKMVFLFIGFALCFNPTAKSQLYDDGFVTNGLPVNAYSEKYQSYVKGVNAGFDQVSGGIIRSNDDIIQIYGLDILQFPRLSDVVSKSNWSVYNNKYSPSFLRGLNAVLVRIGKDLNSINSIRNGFKELSILTPLNEAEVEILASLDITTQIVSSRFINSVQSNSGTQSLFWSSYGLRGSYILPGWARCALGVIGEALLGGLGGVKLGGAIGGTVGGAIGGIIGVVGGAFVGASKYC